jgi:DNA-binding NtrC family response regulator
MRALRIHYKEAIRSFQESFIVNSLIINSCHLGRTARALGMHRNTLTKQSRELNIDIRQIQNMIRPHGRRRAKSD